MSRKLASTQQFLAGESPDLVIPLTPQGVTLSAQPVADNFLPAAVIGAGITVVDLLGVRQVRFTGRVVTVSASVNTPKVQLRYAASYQTVIASYLQMGITSLDISLFTGATFGDTGWVDLVPGAQINSCFICPTMIGGDATVTPVIGALMAHFR